MFVIAVRQETVQPSHRFSLVTRRYMRAGSTPPIVVLPPSDPVGSFSGWASGRPAAESSPASAESVTVRRASILDTRSSTR